MIRKICVALLLTLFVVSAFAQQKPWTEWSKKDAEKYLNDSAWGQTQTETQSTQATADSAVTSTMAARNEDRNIGSATKTESGATTQTLSIKYRIRFLSAKPVREAFARVIVLNQDKPNEELSTQLQGFIDRDFGEYIVVAVSVEGTDRRTLGPAAQAFTTATTDS